MISNDENLAKEILNSSYLSRIIPLCNITFYGREDRIRFTRNFIFDKIFLFIKENIIGCEDINSQLLHYFLNCFCDDVSRSDSINNTSIFKKPTWEERRYLSKYSGRYRIEEYCIV
jgi:hypothetical protein